ANRRRVDLARRGPRDALHLAAHLADELARAVPPAERSAARPLACLFDRISRHQPSAFVRPLPKPCTWQARRDSNPQPPVLETGALPVELLAYSRRYFCSLCGVCFRQNRQYLLSSIRSVVFFLFFVVL